MRVYDRQGFMALPEGTIFAEGVKWAFGGLTIKAETLGDGTWANWVELDPCWVEAKDSGDATDRLEAMLERGDSFPMQDAFGRNGRFEPDAVFLVFERDDLLKLRGFIEDAIKASTESNAA